MKKCPFCAEEIQDEAIKCRYCGEGLKKKWWKNCFFGCLFSIIVSFLLMILFIFLSFAMLKFIVYKVFFAGPGAPQYTPFTGQGIEGLMREFGEAFKALWDKFIGLFQSCPQNYNRMTF